MNTNVDPRAATAASNAPKQDLRAWLAQMEAAGEVTHISGAEREREIGGIVDIFSARSATRWCCSTTSRAIPRVTAFSQTC